MADVTIGMKQNEDNCIIVHIRCTPYVIMREDNDPISVDEFMMFEACRPTIEKCLRQIDEQTDGLEPTDEIDDGC